MKIKIGVRSKKFCHIEESDLWIFKNFKWYADRKNNGKFYARSTCNKFYMHRILMNSKKGEVVDHVNGKTLDNRRSNLRNCKHSNNLFNQEAQKIKKTSKYKGVCFSSREGKFRAYINKSGKQYHLGFFNKEVDAAKSYDERAKFLFGEFACLNFS